MTIAEYFRDQGLHVASWPIPRHAGQRRCARSAGGSSETAGRGRLPGLPGEPARPASTSEPGGSPRSARPSGTGSITLVGGGLTAWRRLQRARDPGEPAPGRNVLGAGRRSSRTPATSRPSAGSSRTRCTSTAWRRGTRENVSPAWAERARRRSSSCSRERQLLDIVAARRRGRTAGDRRAAPRGGPHPARDVPAAARLRPDRLGSTARRPVRAAARPSWPCGPGSTGAGARIDARAPP